MHPNSDARSPMIAVVKPVSESETTNDGQPPRSATGGTSVATTMFHGNMTTHANLFRNPPLGNARHSLILVAQATLDSANLSNELKTLNELYNDCVAARDIKGFHKLVNSSTKEVYLSKLNRLKHCLAYRNKHWILSKVLLPLCFFASFTRWFDTVAETVVIDNTYDKTQTHRDFSTTEKHIEFESKT